MHPSFAERSPVLSLDVACGFFKSSGFNPSPPYDAAALPSFQTMHRILPIPRRLYLHFVAQPPSLSGNASNKCFRWQFVLLGVSITLTQKFSWIINTLFAVNTMNACSRFHPVSTRHMPEYCIVIPVFSINCIARPS